MESFVKDYPVNVRLNRADHLAAKRLILLESRSRGERVGIATLLREFGMSQIRARLAELEDRAA